MSERRVSDCLILAGISLFMSNILTGVLGVNEKEQNLNSMRPYMYSVVMYGYLGCLRRGLPA
jgi:hypothetical protein